MLATAHTPFLMITCLLCTVIFLTPLILGSSSSFALAIGALGSAVLGFGIDGIETSLPTEVTYLAMLFIPLAMLVVVYGLHLLIDED